jgi:Uma2 family endonuclease
MVIASTKPLTLTTFLNLLETKPAREYINGKIIQKSMQGKTYSDLVLPTPKFFQKI